MASKMLAPAVQPPVILPDRKAEHLRIAAGEGIGHRIGTGLQMVRLRHRAMPGRDLEAVRLETTLLGRRLTAPLLISAMTGGHETAATINRQLLDAAAEHGIGLTLGSGRRLLEDPALLPTYRPAGAARPPLLLANLGASQLLGADGAIAAERLVSLLAADGLSIHLNPLQEAIQPEGEARAAGVADAIAATVERLKPLPVVVKEVGFGLDTTDIDQLTAIGVSAIDVAGAGGTNWALIEGERDPWAAEVASAFGDWGHTTLEALRRAHRLAGGRPIIASGGLADGVDCAKCLASGASACALARPLLLAAQAGETSRRLGVVLRQLQIATWLTGAPSTDQLDHRHLQ